MTNNENTLFCEGVGCALKTTCHRFVDGVRIDPHAEGYSWMSNCDIEHRSGYIPTKSVKKL